MSQTEDVLDPSTKYFNQKNKNQLTKLASLIDFIEDPSRLEPLVGLQYVAEIQIPGSHSSIVKCNICRVTGHIKTMKEHLTGLQHIKAYMEMYYFTELQSIRRSDSKIKVVTLINDFAREIERAEGTQSFKSSLITSMKEKAVMHLGSLSWKTEKCAERLWSPFLDRRIMALQYSETFSISSRTEASVVLKLTQQLSDNLEQYFLKGKGLEILPSVDCGKKERYTSLGLASTQENPLLQTEEPSSSSCTSKNILSINGPHNLLEVDSEKKQNQVAPSQQDDDLQSSSDSGSQSTKRRKIEDPDQMPFIFPSIPQKYDESYLPNAVEVPSSSSAPQYNEYTQSLTKSDACDYGPASSNSTTDVKAMSESKPSVSSVTKKKGPTDSDMERKNSDYDVIYSHTSSQDTLTCGQTQGKTSKSLSPDILQLLKGKDARTVTNILKTISPFYPALQDVNLEILAQVLVNTGAID